MRRGSASIRAAPDVLERYQRWRRFDTAAMGVTTDGLNRLFSNRSDALRLVRDVGLGLVDRVPALKGLFIREAAGLDRRRAEAAARRGAVVEFDPRTMNAAMTSTSPGAKAVAGSA